MCLCVCVCKYMYTCVGVSIINLPEAALYKPCSQSMFSEHTRLHNERFHFVFSIPVVCVCMCVCTC